MKIREEHLEVIEKETNSNFRKWLKKHLKYDLALTSILTGMFYSFGVTAGLAQFVVMWVLFQYCSFKAKKYFWGDAVLRIASENLKEEEKGTFMKGFWKGFPSIGAALIVTSAIFQAFIAIEVFFIGKALINTMS